METANDEENPEEAIEEEAEEEEEEEEEEVDIEDFFNKNTESFRCLTQILISRSSILRHPLYNFPPLTDPGLDDAINYVEPPLIVDNVGRELYEKMCKDFNIVPISRVLRSLTTSSINLKYYGVSEKQVRALTAALAKNEFVNELVLEDNWMTAVGCEEIGKLIKVNRTLKYLNLKECRIGSEGAAKLADGLGSAIGIRELDLSFNSLGDEGLMMLQEAFEDNRTLIKLNLSRNELGEVSATTLANIFDMNDKIQELDLSWNGFFTGPGNKILFQSLEDIPLTALNLAWNGIGTREAVTPIRKFLKNAEFLEHFDISNNCLTGDSFFPIRYGLAKCAALKTLKIGNNLLTPDEGLSAARLMNRLKQLDYVNLDNTFFNKDFVHFLARKQKVHKTIIIGGILSNYEIHGPDLAKLYFDRANFLAKKSKKKNFGHFILKLPDQNYTKQNFGKLIKAYRMRKVDKDLITAICEAFPAKKQKISLPNMKEAYMRYFPDTALPPRKKKNKKGKQKKVKPTEPAADQSAQTERTESQAKIQPEREPGKEQSQIINRPSGSVARVTSSHVNAQLGKEQSQMINGPSGSVARVTSSHVNAQLGKEQSQMINEPSSSVARVTSSHVNEQLGKEQSQMINGPASSVARVTSSQANTEPAKEQSQVIQKPVGSTVRVTSSRRLQEA